MVHGGDRQVRSAHRATRRAADPRTPAPTSLRGRGAGRHKEARAFRAPLARRASPRSCRTSFVVSWPLHDTRTRWRLTRGPTKHSTGAPLIDAFDLARACRARAAAVSDAHARSAARRASSRSADRRRRLPCRARHGARTRTRSVSSCQPITASSRAPGVTRTVMRANRTPPTTYLRLSCIIAVAMPDMLVRLYDLPDSRPYLRIVQSAGGVHRA